MLLPPGTHATKQRGTFEADAYIVIDSHGAEVATIFAGGGSYDLKGARRFCLNGHLAWMREDGPSGTLVMGRPGVNSVSVTYTDLLPSQLRAVKTMIASLHISDGETCR